ncbi:MAG: hypothetical protein KAU35_06935 [candidate division Zixibacteria bacterium]|nr:hypothetical protein [candidate division Zixibacteria bacterium]
MRAILKVAVVFILIVAIVNLSGCTRRVLDFTIVSSKNVTMKLADDGKGDRVVGTDYVWWLLSIPLGTPNLKEAVDRAIESAGPDYDALIDGVIYSQGYWFVVTAKTGFKVEGTPIKTTKLIADLQLEGEDADKVLERVLYHSSLDKDNTGAIKKIGITPLIPEPAVESSK